MACNWTLQEYFPKPGFLPLAWSSVTRLLWDVTDWHDTCVALAVVNSLGLLLYRRAFEKCDLSYLNILRPTLLHQGLWLSRRLKAVGNFNEHVY